MKLRFWGAVFLSAAVACSGGNGVTGSGGGSISDGGTGSGSGSGSGSGGSGGGSGASDGGAGSGGATGGGSGGSSGSGSSDGGTGGGSGGGTSGGGSGGSGSGGGGSSDGGTSGGSDGGTGGGSGGATVTFPSSQGWAFYGPQNGGPQDVYDAALDESGNLWVAGGSEGLFLLKPGATTFVKYGLADGLHPYGYLTGDMAKYKGVPDGTPADPNPSLSATPVISVAAGPGGTVFVGYQGRAGCEDAWNWQCGTCAKYGSDGKTCVQCAEATSPSTWGDPAVYKSGDADRVTLNGDGTISVTHYDIFSGPDVVGGEPGGRERLCSVLRMAYDKDKDEIVFGANHGFAVGKASWQENATCGGEYDGEAAHTDCVGVYEHSHPAINGCAHELVNGGCNAPIYLTDSYYGVAVDPTNHDLWMGGLNRSTKFHLWSYGGGLSGYYSAEDDTENTPGAACQHTMSCGIANRWDLWPDAVGELDANGNVNYVAPSQRNDDAVSGIAAMSDGTAWVGSLAHGLIHIDTNGSVLADATGSMMTKNLASVARDPIDESVWAGMAWGLGVSRYDTHSGSVTNYSLNTFGDQLANSSVANIQPSGSGAGRAMVVSFRKTGKTAGAVGVYSGQ